MKKCNQVPIFAGLIITILLILPGCRPSEVKTQSVSLTSKVYQFCNEVMAEQADILALINGTKNENEARSQVKKFLLLRNDAYNKSKETGSVFGKKNTDFPYLQYKELIDKDIRRLATYKKRIMHRGVAGKSALFDAIKSTQKALERINQFIITSDEYHQEKVRRAESSSFPLSLVVGGIFSIAKKIIFL